MRRRVRDALPSTLGVLLAVVGGVLGNVVTDQLPTELATALKHSALPALTLIVIAILVTSELRRFVQGSENVRDPRQRSRRRRWWAGILLVVYELLWAAGGLVENLTAGNLPSAFRPYTGWLLVGVIVLGVVLAVWDYLRQSAPQAETATNRRNFLIRLHTRYHRRQEDALRGAVLITLGLTEEPEAVSRPSLIVGTLSDGEVLTHKQGFPTGADIVKANEEAGGQLLILGAPGAGKSTLLVELGLDMVQRAQRDTKLPLPVLCNLSTWAINRLPLDQWLVEDLVESYQVPRRVAHDWVAGKEILPLLDGLDEVNIVHRTACVAAINTFHQANPQLPLVVCSRLEEFWALGVSLALRQAVVVQPLTDEQIQTYLAHGGQELAALLIEVRANMALREVLRTPLMLRVVTLTYEGTPPEAIPPVNEHDTWVRQVFAEYVVRMLKRRRRLEIPAADTLEEVEQPEFPPEAAEKYLTWLAGQMQVHGQVELYLESLQPDWLPTARSLQLYRMISGLVFGLSGGLLVGLPAGLVYGLINGWVYGLGLGVFVGLIFGWVCGEYYGLGFAESITLAPALQWSWRRGVVNGLGFSLVVGVLSGLGFGLFSGLSNGLLSGLALGLSIGIFGGVMSGVSYVHVPEDDYRTPNEGILRSVRSAMVGMLVVWPATWLGFGLGFGLLFGLSSGLSRGLMFGLGLGLEFGLLAGIFGWLRYGGTAILHHVVLRWVLRRTGMVPPHLVQFLDYSADHVLLQRIGGGYRFVHVLLRDYFADQSQQRSENSGSP
jgi:hypothetical protein